MNIEEAIAAQRAYFRSNATLPRDFRQKALSRLYSSILRHENEINAALRKDLNKCETESYMCEVGMVLSELSCAQKNLRRWMKRRRAKTPLAQFSAKSYTIPRPYGVALIMAPWNYPFLLTMEPLVGAIAAGNCCILKPSPDAPATADVIAKIVAECFAPEHVFTAQGGHEESAALLEEKFDTIFFTGSPRVGRIVMEKAAKHLTPVTLELGGKSPCIIERTAKLDLAAKRVAFGKFLNCGQTCVAPDYVLIEEGVKEEFLTHLKKWTQQMYGENALENEDYVRMVNRRHFERVRALIDEEKVYFGGRSDKETLKIEPTVLHGVLPEDTVMQEEIFGPVLPVLTVSGMDEAEAFVRDRPHPLALYLFTEDADVKERFLQHAQFGGGCINDTIIHLATNEMPFGGVGESGMGGYHGKKSFDAFSHEKSIVDKSTRLDLPMRYAPYTKAGARLIRRFLK